MESSIKICTPKLFRRSPICINRVSGVRWVEQERARMMMMMRRRRRMKQRTMRMTMDD
jgi:hypothetical protein